MSDIQFDFTPELMDLGLVAMADPQFAERMLAAVDYRSEAGRPAGETSTGQAGESNLGAAA